MSINHFLLKEQLPIWSKYADGFVFFNDDSTDDTLEFLEQNKAGVDHYTGDSNYFNSIYIYPQLAKQHKGYSYLDYKKNKIYDYSSIDNYFKNNNF